MDPPDPPVAGPESGRDSAWPEIRFYLGAFSLFFLSYVLVTALLVALPSVLLGHRPVAITSGSMEPAIRVGDVVLFAPPPSSALGPGTVVGFNPTGDQASVTHRIVQTNPDGTYVTRGDANPSTDSTPVGPDDVWGVGRFLVPYGGLPAAWLAVGAVWKVVLLTAFLLACGYAARWALLDEYNLWLGRE